MTIPSPNLVCTEGAFGDKRELPALQTPNVVYSEGESGDNRDLPALLKRARYARPTSQRGRKALAHSLERAMPCRRQRRDARLLLIC